uniref:RPN1 N-terminal domain-containing protein n=1 Tax=Timema shepardi TaxID=629360 RepID=A0A7R9AQE0_TIMSH|nr:unnamed protein product [Timema shepardi]
MIRLLKPLLHCIKETDEKLYHPALECLRDLIRTSTTSMTSVPKPLKYLRTHYNTIKEAYQRMRDPEVQKFCADIISVLAMTQLNETDQAVERDCLKYCLLGTKSDVGDWGHEYVRQLESEIAEEWILITKERNMATKAQLLAIVDMIISFDMSHNAEIQACDLLMEIDEIDRLRDYIDASNYSRVCLYLISCAMYVDKPEYIKIINLALDFFLKFREYTRAMCLAMNLNDVKLMTRIFESCQDGDISPSEDLNKASQTHKPLRQTAQLVFQGGISPSPESWTSLGSSDIKLLQADDTSALEWPWLKARSTEIPPGRNLPVMMMMMY